MLPLALVLRDGESGLGVEDADEAERNTEGGFYFQGLGNSLLYPAMRPTVESSRGPYTIQTVLETGKHNLVALLYMTQVGEEKKIDLVSFS